MQDLLKLLREQKLDLNGVAEVVEKLRNHADFSGWIHGIWLRQGHLVFDAQAIDTVEGRAEMLPKEIHAAQGHVKHLERHAAQLRKSINAWRGPASIQRHEHEILEDAQTADRILEALHTAAKDFSCLPFSKLAADFSRGNSTTIHASGVDEGLSKTAARIYKEVREQVERVYHVVLRLVNLVDQLMRDIQSQPVAA